MTYAAIWFFLAALVGAFAGNRGRSGVGWFLVSLVISPLLGFILCAVGKNLANEKIAKALEDAKPSERTHVKCPKCAEFVLPEAVVCKHCGAELTPDPNRGERLAKADKDRARADAKEALVIVASVIGIALFFILVFK